MLEKLLNMHMCWFFAYTNLCMYIYLHLVVFLVNVGKHTSPMNAMGKGIPPNCLQKFRFRIYHSYRMIRKRKTGEKQWNTRTKNGNNKSWDLWGNTNTYWDDSDTLEMSMSCSLFLCCGGFCRFASSDPWCVIVKNSNFPTVQQKVQEILIENMAFPSPPPDIQSYLLRFGVWAVYFLVIN